jgi:xylulokinase
MVSVEGSSMNHSMSSTDNKYVLAIDVGSSTTKVGLIDQDGAILAQKGQRHDTFYLPGGGVEQNPEDWWKAVSNGAKEIIRDSELNPENIIAISTTSQWSVTVAVDERGSPLMNAISWMDSRGGKYNREIMKGFPSLMGYDVRKLYKWIDIVGFPPLLEGTDCIAHILTIKKEHPDIYRQAYKFLEPMDFINMRLTGKAHATACSYIACVSIDNRKTGTKNYNPWLLEVTGIDRQKLPDLLPIEGIVGNIRPEIALEWGLSRATPVITAASDNSAALIGAGLFSDYEPVAVLGTSGMLMFHVPQKKTDLMRSLTTIPGALNGRNIFSADTGNTARVLDYFLYQLVYPQDEFALEELPRDVYVRLNQGIDQIPPGSDNLLFLPWINTGVLAPVADRFVRGGFINITKSTTRSHLARAILEGIAYNWRWLKESAEAFAKHKFSSWRLCGGGATSDTWAQIMADVVGIPMQRVENPGSTSMIGMAFLAFNRLGLMPVEEIPAKVGLLANLLRSGKTRRSTTGCIHNSVAAKDE